MTTSTHCILIVDDNPEDILVFKRYINRYDDFKDKVHFLESKSVRDALCLVESNEIDCILLDYSLPDKTGNVFLKELHENNIHLPPTIMLTGQRRIEVAVESLKLGAEDYLIKDEINQESLCRAILNAIEKSSLRRQVIMKEQEIKKLAYNDVLTGLPNRASLEIFLSELIEKEQNNQFAVVLLDLDRFKNINDTLGHEIGDLLVKIVALRIQDFLKDNEILLRPGGDEFIILKKVKEDPAEIADFSTDLIALFDHTFELHDYEVIITPSIGIAIYPLAGKTMVELMKCADIAMFKSKEKGGNQFSFYTDEINRITNEKVKIENELRLSIKKEKIKVFFQPILNLDDNKLFGVEALIRFDNEYLSSQSLDRVINIAEQASLMNQIGKIMLDRALEAYVNLSKKLLYPIYLTLNLSAKQLESKSLSKDITVLSKAYNIEPSVLIFELTESVFIDNLERANQLLSKIVNLGAKIYIDDFGTGYSSLSLIQNLPISGLKIDKSFVMNMENDPKSAKLVNSIIILALSNGLSVTAEGVETSTQLNMLKVHPNVQAQGFFISKPVEPEALEKFKI